MAMTQRPRTAPSRENTRPEIRRARGRSPRSMTQKTHRGDPIETPATTALDPDQARNRLPALAVIDVRSIESFERGHLAGSGHVPRSELAVRGAELPPRHDPL